MTTSKAFLRDLAERAIATYVQVVLGLLIVSGVTDLAVIQTALIAGIPATLSVVKSFLAERYVPDTVSPASLVTARFGGSDFAPSLNAESCRDEA